MRSNKTIIPGPSLAASILGLAFAALPSFALTPPAMTIAVTGASVTIDSTGTQTYTGSCSASACPGTATVASGSILWVGTVGNFTINADGRSKPVLTAPDIDLASIISTSASAGGTITISWTDVGFTVGESPGTMNVVPGGATSATYTSYVDNTNTAFGTGIQVGTTTSGGIVVGPGPKTNPFSMTSVEVLTLPAGLGTSGPPFNNDFSLMVFKNPPLSLSCGAATGQVGKLYTSSLIANGGAPPYNYSITGSIAPLVLTPSTGAISGTPTAAGTLSFTATVMDSSGNTGSNTATASCNVVVAPSVPLKAVCPSSNATVGQWYSSSVSASGGAPPYQYSLYFGSLPSGLSLNTSTGVISGTPTKPSQTGAFKIQVTDSAGNVAYTNCTGSCSSGFTVTYGGVPSDYSGQKAVSVIYSSNGLAMPVYGYSTSNQPTSLYSVVYSPNAFLGLSNSSQGNQLDSGHYVQFNVATHIANGANGLSLVIASQSNTSTFDIYGSNTLGSMGTLLVSQAKITSWVSTGSYYTGTASVPNFSSYQYISIHVHSGQCLIQTLSVNYQCSCAIDVSGGQKCPGQCGW